MVPRPSAKFDPVSVCTVAMLGAPPLFSSLIRATANRLAQRQVLGV
jgi:hypothetical protein